MVGGLLAAGVTGFPGEFCGQAERAVSFPSQSGALFEDAEVELELDCGDVTVTTRRHRLVRRGRGSDARRSGDPEHRGVARRELVRWRTRAARSRRSPRDLAGRLADGAAPRAPCRDQCRIGDGRPRWRHPGCRGPRAQRGQRHRGPVEREGRDRDPRRGQRRLARADAAGDLDERRDRGQRRVGRAVRAGRRRAATADDRQHRRVRLRRPRPRPERRRPGRRPASTPRSSASSSRPRRTPARSP